VFPHLPNHLPLFLRSPRNVISVGFGIAVATAVTTYVLTRRKITPEEIERARRDQLALIGRITDGSITETQWIATTPTHPVQHLHFDPALDSDTSQVLPTDTPAVLVYRYMIAGVTYECAQDVHSLAEHVRHVRIDLPVQVRFDPRNPGNSIVVAESWSGLRLGIPHSTELNTTPPNSPSDPSLSHHG